VACGSGINRGSGADPGSGVSPLECSALIFGHATPHTVVLPGFECPGKTLFAHLAPSAHRLGLFDLKKGRTGVTDREEQLWVLV
jgi:hypothetical protein